MRRGPDISHQAAMMHHPMMISPARPNPITMAWRWRYELALIIGLPLALIGLVEVFGLSWAIFAVIAVIIVFIGVPAARHQLIARLWCILTPHRLRTGCARAWIHNRHGRLPAILWCAPKSYGEQVLVWCPAGLTSDDLIAAREVLASACYASEIEVVMHPKYRHIVTLEVIRFQEQENDSDIEIAPETAKLM